VAVEVVVGDGGGTGVVTGGSVGARLGAGVDAGGVGVTGVGDGLGAETTGEAGTGGGAVAGAVPGQARPLLPPQMVLDDAIATIISSGGRSAAEGEPATVRLTKTVNIPASIIFME
jgi:hypothetical protein